VLIAPCAAAICFFRMHVFDAVDVHSFHLFFAVLGGTDCSGEHFVTCGGDIKLAVRLFLLLFVPSVQLGFALAVYISCALGMLSLYLSIEEVSDLLRVLMAIKEGDTQKHTQINTDILCQEPRGSSGSFEHRRGVAVKLKSVH